MTSPYTLFFLLPLLLLLAATAAANDDNNNNLINQTCKNISKTDPQINPNFCIKSLQSAPASRCANLTRLGQITLNLVKNVVTDTKCLIKRLLGDKKVSSKTKQGLQDCLEDYSDSLWTLNEAMNDYKAKRFFDVNVKVSSVMDNCGSCEEGFGDVEVASPLTKQNNDATQLSAIALSIVNMFHRTTPIATPPSGGPVSSPFGRVWEG